MKALLLKLGLSLSLLFAAFALTGCEDNDVEDAADDMGDAMEEAVDEVGDAAEEAGDQLEDATN